MSEDIKTEQVADENIELEAISQESAKILDLEKQLGELTDKYYRANADFENLRKRVEKEKADIASYSNEKFARDLLPVIDALEMGAGFEAEDEFAKKIKEGIELSINEFKKALEKHGVSQISTDGEFDPNVHNAIMRVDSDAHESGAIVQVMQKGYLINGRVLRPAMVSIAN
ncbi:nucleotide exchange factor GrpE [Campylobacter sp. RM9344]|uniref:Protein GrpE n=1 Tax=Campylobacter californiensis TaxID=1032243 RepID=A0AAW3ZWV4_9BACT|nr:MULTISPECIES: nucleotide exchange factor GrpE [unclassified Campylobacter]MBE2984770.1 nucleotide exchange factor GrpE [Campylobacter sp. RM6883]MBE2994764.1 nucleotide exchange factor GrpE [Campylobacter sp. RM6913]MBE3029630.1 nucleotide exchange factor GrpE [Campylobacter sp. RM9344]MBE3608294.1 nucleotide exchange factor GrpE [Campylobacter sp. RM9337]QCD50572.1 DnaK system nucleotide exchange factor GrpE [Campylobacter sp. RM6914]